MIVLVELSSYFHRTYNKSSYYHFFKDDIQSFLNNFQIISNNSLRRNFTISVIININSDNLI